MEKLLTYFLRHGGRKEGLTFRNDGYVRINDLIGHYKFRGATLNTILDIVANDPKAARLSAEAHIDYVMDSFREAQQLRDREHISELRLKQRTN